MVTAHNHYGDLIWEKDLGGVNGGHGFAVSPIVFEDLLIVPNDQEKAEVPIMPWIVRLVKLNGRYPVKVKD